MKRIWVALALLLICGVISATEYITVDKSCDYYTQLIDKADKYISSREFKKASELIESTQYSWEKSKKTLNIFLIHKEADNITESLAKLRECAEEKNKDTFTSVSKKTKRQLLRLKQSELPDLENIL
ncbi:MAG: DUF4363 family protein [Ruminococcus sp.]|nr:DUF4363 family protein [Ruminococcus sp.]